MTIENLMKLIDLQQEVSQMVMDCELPFATAQRHFEQLLDRKTWDVGLDQLKQIFEPDNGGIKMLCAHLFCATQAFERYKALGIDEKIFVDTMKCFVRFVDQHKTVYGNWSFDREWWTVRQISLSLFRIGQLEFELNFVDGQKCISIHIPSDASIAPSECDKSFEAATEFFKKYFPHYQQSEFVCDSWLLSPCLRLLLPPTSNILKFLNRFEILSTTEDSDDFMLYVFNTDSKDYKSLPENTTLQKNMKAHLMSGGKVGASLGVLRNDAK